jgi:hypothetical protein
MSGDLSPERAAAARAAGAVVVFDKPLDLRRLQAVLTSVTNRPSSAADSAAVPS